MKDVCIKDPISMLIPIRFYFLLSEQQETSPIFSLHLSVFAVHSQFFFFFAFILLFTHYNIYFTPLCTARAGISLFMCALISSSECPHLMLFLPRVSVPFFFFFSSEFIRCQTHTSSSPRIWFLFLAVLSVFSFLRECPLLHLCPFTLCPSQLIAFSVSPVFCPGLHPPTFSLNLFTFSFLCLFGKHFLGVFHAKLSSPDSVLSLGETQFTQCT